MVEKEFLKHLHLLRRAKLKDALSRVDLKRFDRSDVWDAVKRLHSRKIIEIIPGKSTIIRMTNNQIG